MAGFIGGVIGFAIGVAAGIVIMCVLIVGRQGDVHSASPTGNYTENKEITENDSPIKTKE